ncbi:hypothetical protein HDV63DRAFT_222990 [Trichoderma sp. SZMC 28014]
MAIEAARVSEAAILAASYARANTITAVCRRRRCLVTFAAELAGFMSCIALATSNILPPPTPHMDNDCRSLLRLLRSRCVDQLCKSSREHLRSSTSVLEAAGDLMLADGVCDPLYSLCFSNDVHISGWLPAPNPNTKQPVPQQTEHDSPQAHSAAALG